MSFLFDRHSSGRVDRDFLAARMRMVDVQIAGRGITDAQVLQAMRKVERHRFVPDEYRDVAYSDRPLPIGNGQTISQPYIVAFMTESLNLKETDRILEIGSGSGYQAAILAEVCHHVFTCEINESLSRLARKNLEQNGYTNVTVQNRNGYRGWPEEAPFDGIMVTCSPSEIPATLEKQLADGGRMILPVESFYSQELMLLRKNKNRMHRKAVMPVRFVPMVQENDTRS